MNMASFNNFSTIYGMLYNVLGMIVSDVHKINTENTATNQTMRKLYSASYANTVTRQSISIKNLTGSLQGA